MSTLSSPVELPLSLLTPLCAPFSKEADWLLKLYEMSSGRVEHPGQCVSCFYALLGSAKQAKERACLSPLRAWIEEHLEIEVNAGDVRTAVLPVRLEEPDLETFCSQAVNCVRADTVTDASEVSLSFRYKEFAA